METIIDFLIRYSLVIFLCSIFYIVCNLAYQFHKLETRLEKLEPESENNKKPKNWFQRLLKWW